MNIHVYEQQRKNTRNQCTNLAGLLSPSMSPEKFGRGNRGKVDIWFMPLVSPGRGGFNLGGVMLSFTSCLMGGESWECCAGMLGGSEGGRGA